MSKSEIPIGAELLKRWEDGLYVIASQEGSSMAAVWTQYFCLQATGKNEFELSARMYEGLGEGHEFFDEELEDDVLPDEIDGKHVVGVDDQIVIGGTLQTYNPQDSIVFSGLSDESLELWLQDKDYGYPFLRSELEEALEIVKLEAQKYTTGI